MQLGTGFVSRQFSYHAGEKTDEHTENGKLKSSPTTQLVSQIVLSGGRSISYEYDAEERITKVTDSVDGTTEYTYDALGQLLTETVNGTVVNTMTYDNYGNIVSKNGTVYTYGDGVWKDLLTKVGEQTITYDAQGNPVSYLGHTLTWEKGRQLKSFDGNAYTYNANGIRTSKTIDGVQHDYVLDGTKILRETWGENVLIPLYDNEDSVCGICLNGEYFYFQKNLQGDIISVTDKDANEVAKYTYDAWGVCTVISDTSACNIATVNPFRYRGYYYDNETQLYYLQSRYYNPLTGRFLNEDMAEVLGLAPLNNDTIILNLYAYCGNNAATDTDSVGRLSEKQLANMFAFSLILDMFLACMLVNQPAALVKVGAYVMKVATPIAAKFLWWKPWLIAVIVLAAVAIVVAGVLVLYNIKQKELKKSATRVLKNVKERITNSKVFKLAYVWGTELVKVGASMSFVTALTVLGVKKAACSLARRYSINPQRPTSCKGSKWGVYSTSQAYAAALAIMLGCTSNPEVHNPGEYGHYHDKNHHIHIWYGYPINYHI